MTIDFHDPINNDALFDIQGKAFYAQQQACAQLGTTLPGLIEDTITQHQLQTVDAEKEQAATVLPPAVAAIQTGGAGSLSLIQSYVQNLLIEIAHDDNPLPAKTADYALAELIKQMEANSESVDASTVGVTITAGASNVGNGFLVASTKRGDGRANEHIYAEDVRAQVVSAGRSASITLAGELSVQLLDSTWPKGSGSSASVIAQTADSSLVPNGDMEDEDDVDNKPDDWIVSVGTIGTTLKMTDVEVQTVAISGTPTGGHYLLSWTNADSEVQTTSPLDYNATSASVQSALRQLTGLELITVAESGTTPNLTHTVTFTGQGGDQTLMTSTNNMTGGTPLIAHGQTSAGTAQVYYGGKAVEFDSDGAELTTLNARVNLQPLTVYAPSLYAITDSVPAAGVITVDLVDGIGGTVITDDEGASNSITFNAADLSTSWQHLSELASGETAFRTPSELPENTYLRVRISTAVSGTSSVFIDDVALATMTELYRGGPYVAAFAGSKAWIDGDEWTVTTTNDRAGTLQEWYNRNFDMASRNLLLPSDSSGSETIPDTVVS